MGLMDMMLYIADENARDARGREQARPRLVTAAMLENIEWQAFLAKIKNKHAYLRTGSSAVDELDVDEDDVEFLWALASVLDAAKTPMTLSEIVRALQHQRVLSLEFVAAARAQTKRLLAKMRALNRVWQDDQGRWAKL